MKKFIVASVVFVFAFLFSDQARATDYFYSWQCHYETCTFTANPVPNVLSYDWKFGDGMYGGGQSIVHTYTPCCGSDLYHPRVTLTYHLNNGSYINVRCYVTYYSWGHVGGDPTPIDYSGTCVGFN